MVLLYAVHGSLGTDPVLAVARAWPLSLDGSASCARRRWRRGGLDEDEAAQGFARLGMHLGMLLLETVSVWDRAKDPLVRQPRRKWAYAGRVIRRSSSIGPPTVK